MKNLTCFFRNFDFSHQKVWQHERPSPTPPPAKDESKLPPEAQANLDAMGRIIDRGVSDQGGLPEVDAAEREKNKEIAHAAGILKMLEGQAGNASVLQPGPLNIDTSGIVASDADTYVPEGTRGVTEGLAGHDLRIPGIQPAGVEVAQVNLPSRVETPVGLTPAAAAQVEARIARSDAAASMQRERAENIAYAQDRLLAGAQDYLIKSVPPGGRQIETSDDSAIIRAIIVSAGGEAAWTRFQKDYVRAKKEGKLKDGKAIETWQRNWIANPDLCNRTDVYADVAEFKARLGKDTTTTVKYAGKEGLQTPEKPFDILRYELSNALGVKGPNPLSGKDLYALYAAGQYPPGVLPVDISVRGTQVTVNSRTGDILVKGPGETAVATIKRPSEEVVAAKLKELGRTR